MWDPSSLTEDQTLSLALEGKVTTTGPLGNPLFVYLNFQFCLSNIDCIVFVVVVQTLSHVRVFSAPWTVAHQTPLSFWSLLMSIDSVMPSNHLILCCSLLLFPSIFPSIRVFQNALGGQRIGASASASVLPMNIQD